MAENLVNPDDDLVGRSLGNYEVIELLGAGGMGRVYMARDTLLGRKVALKLLPASFILDKERVRRFQQEARAASALNHPNILTIYEIRSVDSLHYIATEFIDGETLRKRISRTPLKLIEALDLAIQVAGALAASHEAGIVHRDIKPDNIMLRQDRIVKVLDFGLAKLIERPAFDTEASTMVDTAEGLVMGTAQYMSPEQARGLKVDARTDIWSLGCVLYEMLAAHSAFEGPTPGDVIVSILERDPSPLIRFSGEIPPELDWIVKKALRKECDERYQTGKELLSDLRVLKKRLEFEAELERSTSPAFEDAAADHTSVGLTATETAKQPAAYTTSSAEYLVTEIKRYKLPVTAGLVVAVLGLAAFVWKLSPYFEPKAKEVPTSVRNAAFTQLTDQPGPESVPSLSPDGKSFAYSSQVSGNWDIYLQRVGGRNPINLTKDSMADDTYPAFSPDGERIAFRSERDGGGIYLVGATGESVTRLSDFGYGPSWSPDGKFILVGTEKVPQPSARFTISQLWSINIESGTRQMISAGDVLQPNFSPNQQRIAYWSRASKAGQRESIWTIPAAGGEAVPVTTGAATDFNPVWSPDGNYLYFSSDRGGSMNIWRVRIDEQTGAILEEPEAVTTSGTATSALQLSISRDGRRLAYIAQDDIKNLKKIAFEPSTGKVLGEPVAITRGSMQLWFPEASPDGEWLAASSRGRQRHVYILRTDGTDLRNLTDDDHRHDGGPRWSPDGKRIAFTSRRSGSPEIWIVNRDGSGLRQVTQARGAHYSPWSRNNTIAYSIHAPKNDCIVIEPDRPWNEQTPKYLAPIGDPGLSFEGVSWSPDGKKLAGVKHVPSGAHVGIGIYDFELETYDWLNDFGDWPVWLNDNRHLLFVSQGKILLYDTRTREHKPVLTVTENDVDIGSPGLSPDNRVIYFTYVATESDVWLMSLE